MHGNRPFTSSHVYIIVGVVLVDVYVYIVPVSVNRIRCPSVIVSGIIVPVVRRIVGTIGSTPEYSKDDRPCYINGLIDIIVSVHVNVTDYLNLDAVVAASFHFDRGNILEDIPFQDRLKDDQVRISFNRFNHPQIINLAVKIQVKI